MTSCTVSFTHSFCIWATRERKQQWGGGKARRAFLGISPNGTDEQAAGVIRNERSGGNPYLKNFSVLKPDLSRTRVWGSPWDACGLGWNPLHSSQTGIICLACCCVCLPTLRTFPWCHSPCTRSTVSPYPTIIPEMANLEPILLIYPPIYHVIWECWEGKKNLSRFSFLIWKMGTSTNLLIYTQNLDDPKSRKLQIKFAWLQDLSIMAEPDALRHTQHLDLSVASPKLCLPSRAPGGPPAHPRSCSRQGPQALLCQPLKVLPGILPAQPPVTLCCSQAP